MACDDLLWNDLDKYDVYCAKMQNYCFNYANVTAFLLMRSDSESATKLSSSKWQLWHDWQTNTIFQGKISHVKILPGKM